MEGRVLRREKVAGMTGVGGGEICSVSSVRHRLDSVTLPLFFILQLLDLNGEKVGSLVIL